MKILMISNYGSKIGGAEIYMFNLKEELEKRGYIVKILSSNAYPEKKHFNDYEFKGFNEKSVGRIIYYIFNPCSYFELKKILKESKPDVVHLHTISRASASILLCLKNIATVMTVHDYALICPDAIRLLPSLKICNRNFGRCCFECIGKRYYWEEIKYGVYKKLLKNVDVFIPNSKFVGRILKRNKIRQISKDFKFGIRLLNYSMIREASNLLYVGRLTKEKGVEYILKAMPAIIKKILKTHLNIVGDGPEKENLKKLSKQLKLEKHVTFFGQIPNKEIGKYYKESTIAIVPSIWPEPFGLIGPEAMSVGRPVIASNVGGTPEWLEDGKTGYLVEPRNPKQIAEKVIKLLSNRKLMEKMGRNARKKVEKEFDIKKHVKEIEKVYREVIDKYKKI